MPRHQCLSELSRFYSDVSQNGSRQWVRIRRKSKHLPLHLSGISRKNYPCSLNQSRDLIPETIRDTRRTVFKRDHLFHK